MLKQELGWRLSQSLLLSHVLTKANWSLGLKRLERTIDLCSRGGYLSLELFLRCDFQRRNHICLKRV